MILSLKKIFESFGSLTIFYGQLFKSFMKNGLPKGTLGQVGYLGWQSLGVTLYAGLFAGAILAIQFYVMLSDFGGEAMIGGLNTSANVRQVAPLLIAFLLSGKIGAFTSAELGTMKVTEQIDAIRCLGIDPIWHVVLPRFLGMVIASILLLTFGVVMSVLGGMIASSLVAGINPLQYIAFIPRVITSESLISGFFKSSVFGLIIGGVSCHQGISTTGGARGVGITVTRSAVTTMLLIVLADFLTSQIMQTALKLLDY